MNPLALCLLAIVATLVGLVALAHAAPPWRRRLALLSAVPGVALVAAGWAMVAIWMGATLVLGWIVAEAVGRTHGSRAEG